VTSPRRRLSWAARAEAKADAQRLHDCAPVADVIHQALATHGLTEAMRAHRLLTDWRDLVGPRIAARTWPDGLSKRTLWIRVASSAWLHELSLLKAQLLDMIHTSLGEPRLVDDLRFHIGDRRRVDADDALAGAAFALRTRRAPTRLPLPPPATGDALARIDREAGSVDDDELRELIRSVRVRHNR